MVAILRAYALVVRLVNMVTTVTNNVELIALLDVIRAVESVLAPLDTLVKHVIKNAVSNVFFQHVTNSLENVYMDVRLVFGCPCIVINLVQRTARMVCVMLHHHIVLLVVYLVFMERHACYHAVPHVLATNVNETWENVPQGV